jgi:hypothetical protein
MYDLTLENSFQSINSHELSRHKFNNLADVRHQGRDYAREDTPGQLTIISWKDCVETTPGRMDGPARENV